MSEQLFGLILGCGGCKYGKEDELFGDLVALYTDGYHAGHEDTVEARYTDVPYHEARDYFRDAVSDLVTDPTNPNAEHIREAVNALDSATPDSPEVAVEKTLEQIAIDANEEYPLKNAGRFAQGYAGTRLGYVAEAVARAAVERREALFKSQLFILQLLDEKKDAELSALRSAMKEKEGQYQAALKVLSFKPTAFCYGKLATECARELIGVRKDDDTNDRTLGFVTRRKIVLEYLLEAGLETVAVQNDPALAAALAPMENHSK